MANVSRVITSSRYIQLVPRDRPPKRESRSPIRLHSSSLSFRQGRGGSVSRWILASFQHQGLLTHSDRYVALNEGELSSW